MRVDGELVFDPEGKVIEQKVLTPKLSAELEQLAIKGMRAMRFMPVAVDGRPVNARTFTRMTFVARTLADGKYSVGMESAHFFKNPLDAKGGSKKEPDEDELANDDPKGWSLAKHMGGYGIRYPVGLMRAGVSGAVVLRVLLRENGTVEDVFVAQSALFNVRGKDAILEKARAAFERETLKAARRWRFNPPDLLGLPNDVAWRTGDVPVFFSMDSFDQNKPGQWRQEARGPRRVALWEARRDASLVVGVSDLDGDEGMVMQDPRIKRIK